MILLSLLAPALASGLLYDTDAVVPLADLSAEVLVTGRIAEATTTYTFSDPGLGEYSFAALLPTDAAVTGLRYREGEGAWISAVASDAASQEEQPGPWGDPRDLLDGQIFVVRLPALSGETLQVALDWQRVLAAEQGALSVAVPLADGGLDEGDPTVSVSLAVDDTDLGEATLSPAGSLEASETAITASWSGQQSEADAVTLGWAVAAPELNVRVWAYKPETDPFTGEVGEAGYALVVLQPGLDASARADQIFSFVLDTSASMDGEPLEAAVAAGSTWIGDLAETDRFNLIPYQSQPWPFRAQAPEATDRAVEKGRTFLEKQEARGLSDPADALVEALNLEEDTILQRGLFSCGGTARENDSAPPEYGAEVRSLDGEPSPAAYVVWLTDGGASSGLQDIEAITEAVSDANGFRASLYAVGVGSSVDQELLSAVTGANRGAVRFAETVDQVGDVVATLQDRIRHPVIVQPSVEVDGVWDQAPAELQDASEGYELVLAFRYEDAGEAALILRGVRGAEDLEQEFSVDLPAVDGDLPAVARAWAQLRVDDLDARYAAGETGLYEEIAELVGTYGVASEVVTLSFGDEVSYAGDAMAMGASGCGCGVGRRARAGGLVLGVVVLVVLARRR